jgi:hypothetical protein
MVFALPFFFTLICPFRHLAFFTGVFSFSFFFFCITACFVVLLRRILPHLQRRETEVLERVKKRYRGKFYRTTEGPPTTLIDSHEEKMMMMRLNVGLAVRFVRRVFFFHTS